MPEVGRQRKNQALKGGASCCGRYISFLNLIGRIMDKKKVIKVLTNAAKLYKEYLENQKVLFVYGLPFEVKKQLN